MEWLTEPQALIALLTLTALEIVLGIDNIIFISILAGKLPENQREKARKMGLGLALITRVALLFSLSWLIKLEDELFRVLDKGFSGRDLILLAGGLFLIGKATVEIHEKVELPDHKVEEKKALVATSFQNVLIQIMILDVVFSLDSVITAVGMVDRLAIMITAVIVAVGFMLIFVNKVSDFVDNHPTIKVLALSFLIMIGFSLVGEGLHFHIPKGYVYFAMAFSVAVEMINIRVRKVEKGKKHH